MRMVGSFLLCLVAVLAIAASAAAQTVQFKELPRHLKVGDAIVITDAEGRRGEGKVTDLTASTITLQMADSRKFVFPERSVRNILKVDSKWDGALIGFLAGAVPGSRVTQFSCGEFNTCDRQALFGVLIFGGLGMAIGAGIDESKRKVLYLSPQSGKGLTVSPIIGGGSRGALISLRF
jgi:hypothetical protein